MTKLKPSIEEDGYDDDWDDWKPGDMVRWEDLSDPDHTPEPMVIDHLYLPLYAYWLKDGKQEMTRVTNLVRIKKA